MGLTGKEDIRVRRTITIGNILLLKLARNKGMDYTN